MDAITIKDVARICGVGVTTVSRAINNHPDISEDTKVMVMRTIKENHYVPNNSARNLKRSASKTIAILIKGITIHSFNRMLQVFEKETQKRKYSYILQWVDEDQDEIDVAIELEKEKHLEGIVFLGGYFSHTKEKIDQLTVPFVLSTIGIMAETDKNRYSSVSVDDFIESYKMVNYLCSLGHKKIAIISASIDDGSIGKLRFEGYKKALEDNDIEFRDGLVGCIKEDVDCYSMENGYLIAKQLLKSNEDFTAIFAVSDNLAVGTCRAIMEAGKKVPDDYSVAGFDGIEISYYYSPSITTIRQPVEQIAQETIRVLFDLIYKKITHENRILPAKLIIGESAKILKEVSIC